MPRGSKKEKTKFNWLEIPDKVYFTIGETAKLCGIKHYTLRFWEQEFKQLSPTTRKGNWRYYQRQDILLIREIQHMLYTQKLSIEGARQILMNKKKRDNSKANDDGQYANVFDTNDKVNVKEVNETINGYINSILSMIHEVQTKGN